jgi:membrane protease YdiL (CAAX protease family)
VAEPGIIMLIIGLELITLRGVLLGALLFLLTFAISLAIVAFIMVRIPANYFQEDYSPQFLSGRHPVIRIFGLVGKNVLGVLLVALGIVMSIPGVPGQGILTILLGIMLLDFPGRRRMESRLVSRPRVLGAINKLRHRFGKPNLVLD